MAPRTQSDVPRSSETDGTSLLATDPDRLRFRGAPLDVRLYRAYGYVLGVLLVGYMFLDRGFAHFHLPKAKVVYVGEMTLALGVVAVLVGMGWFWRAIARDALIATLLAFMAWCALHASVDLRHYDFQDVVRDSALWYYGGFLLVFVAAATAVPDLPAKLLRGFRRVVPWLTIWLPTGLLLQRSSVKGPKLRGISGVPLFSHRPGNVCCVALLCLAFLLLVPQGEKHQDGGVRGRLIPKSFRPWLYVCLVGLNFFTIALGATQTRGGGLACSIALVLIFVFMNPRKRSRVLMALFATTFLVLGFATVTGVSYHTSNRTVSVSQLLTNAQSILGSNSSSGGGVGSGAQLQTSVNFRTQLWGNVLHVDTSTGSFVTGLGFGPNLAQIGGLKQRSVSSAAAEQLRSAHNSLLDILARSGLIGASLFALFWAGWFLRMWRARRRSLDDDTRGVIGMCLCASTAIFINSFFDPTLEGAQVAAVVYTLAAIGIICARTPIMAPLPEARGLRRPAPVLDRPRPVA
jgi:O-Antigen ligase